MSLTCDSQSGFCSISHGESKNVSIEPFKNSTLIYIGDPMCSLCWGMAPITKSLEKYCRENNIHFSILMGGLRPGGGDKWNDEFRNFLHNEWQKVHKLTKQKFGFQLLTKKEFNYDTEPACRAVVSVKLLLKDRLNDAVILDFFHSIQKKFYEEGFDPTEHEFYRSICQENGIHYESFLKIFTDPKTFEQTNAEFNMLRLLNIFGLPSFAFYYDGKISNLHTGYVSEETIIKLMDQTIQN